MANMQRSLKKPVSTRLKAIRNVKALLKEVNVNDVAAHLNCTRSNIYFHLAESKADKVSLPHLKKIADAIKAVKQKNKSEEDKLANQLAKQV